MICLVILAVVIFPQTSYAWVDFGCRTAIFDLNCGIGELLYNLAAAFAFICGNILDLVVRFFVFEMTTTLETGNLFALQEGDIPTYRFVWFIVRDLANLSFIFILIYAALATIFQIQSVNIRRVIPQLILVAILMNFSLFFVQVATDFSNYLSYQFFTAVEINVAPDTDDSSPVGLGSTGSTTAQIGQSQQQGLSNIIMNVTRITALIGTPEAGSVDNLASSGSAQNPGIAFGVFASIFTIIGALVMLAGAMLLFIRFFMIVIYMIASPIAFAASITQGGKDKITKNWWLKGLTAQLAFAPAYFGLLYLSLIFLSAMTGEGAFNPSGNDGILAYWVRNAMIFIVSSAFLIFALIASKRIGAVGGNFALRMTKQGAGAIIGGGSAWAMRKTLGAGASRLSSGDREKYLQNKIAKGGFGGQMARMQLKSFKTIANQGFDIRSGAKFIPGISKDDLKFVAEGDLGRGYDKRQEETNKKREKEADETRKFLDEDAKSYYNARLATKKDGLLGALYGVGYKRDRNGIAIPRAGMEQFLEVYKSAGSSINKVGDKVSDKFKDNPIYKRLKALDSRIGGEEKPIYYPSTSKKRLEKLESAVETRWAERKPLIKSIQDDQAKIDTLESKKVASGLSDIEEKQLADLIEKQRNEKVELNRLNTTIGNLISILREARDDKVFYEKKSSNLSEADKIRYEEIHEVEGIKAVKDKINKEFNTDAERDEQFKQYQQHRKDQLGDDMAKAFDDEKETVVKDMTEAERSSNIAQNSLLQTTKEIRKITDQLAELEDLKKRHELNPFAEGTKELRRMNTLIGQQNELENDKNRLESLKESRRQAAERAQAEASKKINESLKRLSKLDALEVALMKKNVNVEGGAANVAAALAGIKELQNARQKKDKGFDYQKFADAVERGVDDSNIGGDRNRNEGDR